jgi:hypothetical protein
LLRVQYHYSVLLLLPSSAFALYCHIVLQVVDEVFDAESAAVMGLSKGSVCILIHSGSRGLGHQVGCTELHLHGADW